MQLTEDIKNYYMGKVEELGDDKRFHFATRISAWQGDPKTYTMLKESRDYIAPPNTPLVVLLADILNTPQTGRRNAHELRQPFFAKYPKLYGAHLALFRVRHLKEVYGIDARKDLFISISKQELLGLRNKLLNDPEAIKYLSTFAVNFCFLLDRVILEEYDSLPIKRFIEIGSNYNLTDKNEMQLFIYLYTHCIIGESNFYTRDIPEERIPPFHEMLSQIELLIINNFNSINLDNKLEFLVCARICSYETSLSDKIYDECQHSVSDEGTFLIDKLNDNIQKSRSSFIKSEHRNILFIMSCSPYNPHSTLLTEFTE